jgi:hypothetical protein
MSSLVTFLAVAFKRAHDHSGDELTTRSCGSFKDCAAKEQLMLLPHALVPQAFCNEM